MSKKPARILFLVPDLSASGGVANYYKQVLPRLATLNSEFIVDHMQMPIGANGLVGRVRQLMSWLTFSVHFIVYSIIRRPVLMVCNPSLFRFCLVRDGFFVALMKKLNKNCRTIVFFRGWNIVNEIYLTGPKSSCFTPALFQADVVLSLTTRSQAVLSKLVSPCTDLGLFHTVVDPILEATIADEVKITKTPDSFLFLGNVAVEKGIFELLTAFSAFSNDNPSARLTIYGVGAALPEVQAFIRDNTLEDVIEAPGLIGGLAKYKALMAAEVFLLPSYSEGMPNAVLEALAAECLVIGTPVGAMEEFINEGLIASVEVKSSESILTVLSDIENLRVKTNTKRISNNIIKKYGIGTTLEYFESQFKISAECVSRD